MNNTVAFYTLGCKVNQYETQFMKELFIKNDFVVIKDLYTADIVIVNSCTVTAESERKAGQMIRGIKKNNPSCILLLCGCMAQNADKEKIDFDLIDVVFGNNNHDKVLDFINEYKNATFPIYKVEPHFSGEEFNSTLITDFDERTRAYIKIQDGCNRFCSYCAICYARGRSRSKCIDDIRTEAVSLAKNGYKEIVLVGINLSSYGLGEEYNLCDAVDAVAQVDGIENIRLGSIDPDLITEEMLIRLSQVDKFCPQFHLSMQSGCDATLKRMNRHYTTSDYKAIVTKIREIFCNPAVTTDIMVGFPGETDEEFEITKQFVTDIEFSNAHVFCYSRREGTMAYNMADQVIKRTKEERSVIIRQITSDNHNKFLKNMIGKEEEVIFESVKEGYIEGYTKNYCRVRVYLDNSVDLEGQKLKVKINKIENKVLLGTII